MELDGYNDELAIAFEHQGAHHHTPVTYTGEVDQEKYDSQVRRDQLKRKICKAKGIRLIEIPEVPRLTKLNELKAVIKQRLEDAGVALPDRYDRIDVNVSQAYAKAPQRRRRITQALQRAEKSRDHNETQTQSNECAEPVQLSILGYLPETGL